MGVRDGICFQKVESRKNPCFQIFKRGHFGLRLNSSLMTENFILSKSRKHKVDIDSLNYRVILL
jgi:hypothetical protein